MRLTVLDVLTKPTQSERTLGRGTHGTSGTLGETGQIPCATPVPPILGMGDKLDEITVLCPTGRGVVEPRWNTEDALKQGVSHLSHVPHLEGHHRLTSECYGARQSEVSRAWSAAFSRLSLLYPDTLAGNLWAEVVAMFPSVARDIDAAEKLADIEALAYQSGKQATLAVFLAALGKWERETTSAIEALASHQQRRCSDCGKHASVLLATDYGGRYCRRCQRGG